MSLPAIHHQLQLFPYLRHTPSPPPAAPTFFFSSYSSIYKMLQQQLDLGFRFSDDMFISRTIVANTSLTFILSLAEASSNGHSHISASALPVRSPHNYCNPRAVASLSKVIDGRQAGRQSGRVENKNERKSN